VTFLGGNPTTSSFDNIFGGSDFTELSFWNDANGANAAAAAVASALGNYYQVKAGPENVDSRNAGSDAFLVPWSVNSGNVRVFGDFDFRASVDLLNTQSVIGRGTTSLLSPQQSRPVPKGFKWAVFEQSSNQHVQDVPEPASLLGLAAIGAVAAGNALKNKAAG
jgi:hypothetical protein